MEQNNGGPAFPCPQDSINQNIPSLGMTLRDYFAAKAMGGMCTGSPAPQKNEIDYLATRSYEMADAMLKARQ